MITTNGKTVIIDYFGGQVPHIADYIALGTGTTAATLADTALATETVRLRVTSISADVANNRIIFKTTVSPGQIDPAVPITEAGIYSNGAEDSAVLVARWVLGTPATVSANVPTEIEYSLVISL